MTKLVTVTINEETATFSVDNTGFKGKGCEDIIKAFESLGTITASKKKPEYLQKDVKQQQQTK